MTWEISRPTGFGAAIPKRRKIYVVRGKLLGRYNLKSDKRIISQVFAIMVNALQERNTTFITHVSDSTHKMREKY
jgi:hypothetical protein